MSRGPAWTSSEHQKLRYQRDVEKRAWSEISIPGRSAKACAGEYHARRFAHLRHEMVQAKPPLPEPKPKRGRPPLAPSPVIERKIPQACRADHLDALRERAELQLRIAEQGLTGGWFGDPPPGRSALDQRRAAASLPTLASSHVDVTSSSRDGRDLPGRPRSPTSPQVTT